MTDKCWISHVISAKLSEITLMGRFLWDIKLAIRNS